MAMIWIQTIFKTARLGIIIIMISYFVGTFFFIIADIASKDKVEHDHDADDKAQSDYINFFKLDELTMYELISANTYFASTSLTTVGFGDFHPKSDLERLIIAFMLLLGVAVVSYFMGNLIEIIHVMRGIDSSLSDGDNLSKFFGLL
jgi:hypothetical protein